MSSFLFLLIFLFSHCVTLYFQKYFQQPGDGRQAGNFKHQEPLEQVCPVFVFYWSFIYWYFCSHSSCLLIFSEIFSAAWWCRASRKFQHQEPPEKVCPVFLFFIDILFIDIFVLTLCSPYLFRSIFSSLVMQGKHGLSIIGNHLSRYSSFFIDILLIDIFVLTLCPPYIFRRLFSSLVMEGKQEFQHQEQLEMVCPFLFIFYLQ